MTISTDIRKDKIKYLYDEAVKLKTPYISIYHKDPVTLEDMNGIVTRLDLEYLKDIGFIDIICETIGEISTHIIVKHSLIEYIEESE